MADDVQGRLEALGAAEVEPPSEQRMAAIEGRVMVATRAAAPEAPVRRRPVLVLLAAAAVLVVLFAGVSALTRGSSDLRLASANAVTLELPGQAAEPGGAGAELPDGTVVLIGEGGAAVVDGIRFGPGRYVVANGSLVEHDSGDSPVGSTRTTTTTSPPDRSGSDRPGDATTSTVAAPTLDRPPTTLVRQADQPSVTTDTVRDRSTTTTTPTTPTTTRPPQRDRPSTTTTSTTTTTVVPVRDRPAAATTSTTTTTTTTPPREWSGDRP